MKNEFKQYYEYSDLEFRQLWDNCLFIFDSNVLLNLYRYSDVTFKSLDLVFSKIHNRLWLPFQVAKEFYNDRLDVIVKQSQLYRNSVKEIEEIEAKYLIESRSPFLSEKLQMDFIDVTKRMKEELNTKMETFHKMLEEDYVLSKIEKYFSQRVGPDYLDTDLKRVLEIGKERYENKIPPGFCDEKKENGNKFGDLIIWFQILNKAKETQLPIIFVTDDRKEDWWLIKSGKTIGPRPELKKEFLDISSNLFHIYNPFNFLNHANTYLETKVEVKTLEEVKKLSDLKSETSREKTLLISLSFQKTKKSDLEKFIKLLKANGYDANAESIDDQKCKVFIQVPNIPDLPRRVKERFLDDVGKFGLKLVEFESEIQE